MSRLVPLYASALALLVAAPALGADYDLRPAFPDDYVAAEPLGFEVGVGYWYSMGGQSYTIGGEDFSADATAQFGEVHARIDDYSTSSYLKANLGYAYSMIGADEDNTGDVLDGKMVYAGADFGYNPWGTAQEGLGFTPFVGYQYWNDSPNTGRVNFTTATSADDVNWPLGADTPNLPGDSSPNNIDVHALRLGMSSKLQMNDFVDLSGEVAAVPYARVDGTFGAFGVPDIIDPGVEVNVQSSAAQINGSAYGAMGELSIGLHPTDNMILRLGGRAWYLQGTAQTTYSRATITAPEDTDGDGFVDVDPEVTVQNFVVDNNPFSLFRYGAIAQLSVAF